MSISSEIVLRKKCIKTCNKNRTKISFHAHYEEIEEDKEESIIVN